MGRMNKVLPILVCAAVGAVVVILVLGSREDRKPGAATAVVAEGASPGAVEASRGRIVPLDRPATRTRVSKNAALSDLELFVARKDQARALYARSLVCEQMDQVLADPTLRGNLLELIRTEGIESDDLVMRDVLLPILRVLATKEATALVESEYYRARNEDERKALLEAMAHTYHNPKRAGTIAVQVALHAETEEERWHAFDMVRQLAQDDAIVFDMCQQIAEATSRGEQRKFCLETVSAFAYRHPPAQTWLRLQLKKAPIEEVPDVVQQIGTWGDEADAAQLEALADDYPAMGEMLRMKAEELRRTLKERRRNEELGRKEGRN